MVLSVRVCFIVINQLRQHVNFDGTVSDSVFHNYLSVSSKILNSSVSATEYKKTSLCRETNLSLALSLPENCAADAVFSKKSFAEGFSHPQTFISFSSGSPERAQKKTPVVQ